MREVEIEGTPLYVVSEAALSKMVEQAVSRAISAYRHVSEEGLKAEAYLTIEEVSALLRVTRKSLWSWEKKGYLVPSKVGSKSLYRRSEVEKLLEKKARN